MTDKIKAVFIGGPANGRKMEINPRSPFVRVPVMDPKLTPTLADPYRMPTKDLTYEVVEYHVHLVDVRGYPPVAICTLDLVFDWSAALLALVDGYNPGGQS